MFWRSQGADDKAVIKIYIHGLGPIAKKGSLGFKPNVKKKNTCYFKRGLLWIRKRWGGASERRLSKLQMQKQTTYCLCIKGKNAFRARVTVSNRTLSSWEPTPLGSG